MAAQFPGSKNIFIQSSSAGSSPWISHSEGGQPLFAKMLTKRCQNIYGRQGGEVFAAAVAGRESLCSVVCGRDDSMPLQSAAIQGGREGLCWREGRWASS